MKITEEMREHSKKRNLEHISRVALFGKDFGQDFSDHDADKLTTLRPEYDLINWSYHLKWIGEEPLEYTQEMADATFKHVTSNAHHPEYHDPSVRPRPRTEDRDDSGVKEMVDATSMDMMSIVEMVCDWCSVSVELDDDPYRWAKENINKRWKFTPEQEAFIYECIDHIVDINRDMFGGLDD